MSDLSGFKYEMSDSIKRKFDKELERSQEKQQRRQRWLKRLGLMCHRAYLVSRLKESKDIRVYKQIMRLDRIHAA